MTSGGAKRYPGYGDRTKASMDDTTDLYSLLRTIPFSPNRIQAPIFGAGSAAGPGTGFLRTEGDTMMGPIAFSPRDVLIDSNGRIDISKSTSVDYSTYILVQGAGTPDDLRIIEGAGFNGQYLILQGTAAQTINLIHAKLRTISNITGTGTVTVTTSTDHNYTTGNLINIIGTTNFNVQDVTITVTGATTFTYSDAGDATPESTGTTQNSNIVTTDGNDVALIGGSDNDIGIAVLIFDVLVAGFGAWRIVGGTAGGSGSQTPWLSDIDAAGFKLFGLKQLEFNNQLVITDPTLAQFGADPTGDLVGNVATGNNFQSRINDSLVSRLEFTSSITTFGLFKDATPATGLATRINFVANNITPTLLAFGVIDMDVEATTAGDEEGSIAILVRDQGNLDSYISFNLDFLHEIHTNRDIIMSIATNITNNGGAYFLNTAENMSIQEVGTTIMELNSNAGVSSSIQFKAENDLVLNINKTSAQFTSPGIAVSMGQLGLEGRDPAPIFAVDGFFWHNDVTGPLKGHVFVRTAGVNVDLATLLTNPLTAELDADTFDIFDVDRVDFFTGTSSANVLAHGIYKKANDTLAINFPTNEKFAITEAETNTMFQIDGTANEVQVIDSFFTLIDTDNPTSKFHMIKVNDDRTIIDEPVKMQFQIGSVTQFELTDANLNFLTDKGVISNIDQLGFRNIGNIIEDDDTTGMVYTVRPVNDAAHTFDDGTDTYMILEHDFMKFPQTFANGGWYFDLESRANPGVTATERNGRIFMDSNNSNHLSIVRTGTPIDLEAGGTVALLTDIGDVSVASVKGNIIVHNGTSWVSLPVSGGSNDDVLTIDSAQATGIKWAAAGSGAQTPWASNIDAAGFNLNNVGQIIEFQRAAGGMELQFVTGANIGNNTSIGVIRFNSHDQGGASVDYATVRGVMEDDTIVDEEEGSLQFSVQSDGVTNVLYMTLNDGGTHSIRVHKDINFVGLDADSDIENVNNLTFRQVAGSPAGSVPYIDKTLTEMNFNVPDTHTLDFRINKVTQWSIEADGTWTSNGAQDMHLGGGDVLGINIISSNGPTGTGQVGTTALFFDTMWSETYRFRGSGGATGTGTSDRYVTADGSRMIFNMPANDSFTFRSGGDEILIIDDDKYMYPNAGGSSNFGYFVTNVGGSVGIGAEGTIECPHEEGGVGNATQTDTSFGSHLGAIGIYMNSGGNPVFCVREVDGDWATEILTGGDIT